MTQSCNLYPLNRFFSPLWIVFLNRKKNIKITPWKWIQKRICWETEDVFCSTLERTSCSEKTVANDLEKECNSWEMKCAVTFSNAFTTVFLWFWVVSPCQHKPRHLGTKTWSYWSLPHSCHSTCQLFHISVQDWTSCNTESQNHRIVKAGKNITIV